MPTARSWEAAHPEQTVWSDKPGGPHRPSQYKSHLPGHPFPAKLGSVDNFSPVMGARIGTK